LLVVMIEKLAFQLRNTNTMCSTIAVRIRYANRDTETMQQKIAYTANDDILIKVASELFDKLYHRRMLLRLVGVKLSGLVPGHHQIDMFRDSIKLLKLYQAMDRMKHRFNNPILIRRATGFSAYES
jgi:DNA polymerase-4